MGDEKKNIVILGRTASGKSSVIKKIGELGNYNVLAEMGRTILNFRRSFEPNKEEVKKRQILMYDFQLRFEEYAEGTTFFERALPCSLVYTKYFLGYIPFEMESGNFMKNRYHRVFVLDSLKFERDGVRVEADEKMAQEIQDLTEKTYQELDYDLIRVSKFSNDMEESLERRVKFIFDRLN